MSIKIEVIQPFIGMIGSHNIMISSLFISLQYIIVKIEERFTLNDDDVKELIFIVDKANLKRDFSFDEIEDITINLLEEETTKDDFFKSLRENLFLD